MGPVPELSSGMVSSEVLLHIPCSGKILAGNKTHEKMRGYHELQKHLRAKNKLGTLQRLCLLTGVKINEETERLHSLLY